MDSSAKLASVYTDGVKRGVYWLGGREGDGVLSKEGFIPHVFIRPSAALGQQV